jgi:cob(I)alamin adenosyltransferase
MAFRIYTKTGDKGKTALIGGTKVPKSHMRIEAYGTVDELNSFIGLLIDQLNLINYFTSETQTLRAIQDRLFTVGSTLACDPDKEPSMKLPDLKEEDVHQLEELMDKMDEELPEMRNFILPGGHVAVSTAHIVRCVCRRAERHCVLLMENDEFVSDLVIKYLNRLSDYFFVLSRYIGMKMEVAEIPWKPRG